MNKKWVAVLAALAVTAAAFAADFPSYLKVSGTTLTGYTDSLPASLVIPKGITKIAGGAFADCGRLESVTIPGSVKTIGEDITLEELEEKDMDEENVCVFYNCGSLRNVTIEKGVTTIGFGAFAGCTSLTSVTIPNSVTTIGFGAFASCTSLTSVTIPDSVTAIGLGTFYGCESLERVTIPDSVTEIGAGAFYGCKSLTSVIIPRSVKTIGEDAFDDCENIAVVTYKGSLKDWCAVDWDYFLICNAKRIALSDGTDLRKLTEITANDLAGVTKIGEHAFAGCESLASVTIPGSVTAIGEDAFDDCENIAVVTYKGSLKDWCAVDWDFSLICNAEHIMLSDGTDPRKLTEITANDLAGVTKIGEHAFDGCTSLASVTIPNSVTEIGDDAFSRCESLVSVTIPNSVTKIGDAAFWGCESLVSVTIPNSVTEIGGFAFMECKKLKVVQYGGTKAQWNAINGDKPKVTVLCTDGVLAVMAVTSAAFAAEFPSYLIVDGTTVTGYTDDVPANLVIPTGITKIAGGAFFSCGRLESVTIPGSVKVIGEDITLEEGKNLDLREEDTFPFAECTSLKSVTIETGVKTIGLGAFDGCVSLAHVTIPDSVRTIGAWAFRRCKIIEVTYKGSFKEWCAVDWPSYLILNAKSIRLSDGTDLKKRTRITANDLTGVARIGEAAFAGCTLLTSVTIPDDVTEIGWGAFGDCTRLASVTIPKSVTSIDSWAFDGCKSVEVTYKGSLKEWCAVDWNRFLIVNKRIRLSDGTDPRMRTVVAANDLTGATRIGKYAFYGSTSLTSVTIPESVTEIGDSAFSGCTSLASMTIPDGVMTIGADAFRGCTLLASVMLPESVTEIGAGAFDGCTSLASVTIPNSVTKIGYGAFSGCTLLASVTVPASITEIGGGAFNGCKSLATVAIPRSVTKIGEFAFFGCESLASVTIPNGVTAIGLFAFNGCMRLTSVTIPASVTEIGFRAFARCSPNLKVQYDGTKAQWNAINGDKPKVTVLCTDGVL